MKRSALKRKPRAPRVSASQKEAAAAWAQSALKASRGRKKGRGQCAAGGYSCGSDLQVHHIVPQRILKQEGFEEHLWDSRNALVVCKRCHERHELAVRRLPRSLIDQEAHDFAGELGLEWVIDRFYSEEEGHDE